MNWVGVLLLVIHIAVCVALILIVLLQAGKGASLGAAFGAGSGQTLFGTQSANFISKFTWVLAAVFMLTSLLLTMISPWGESGVRTESTILQQEPIPEPPLGETAQPVLPDATPLTGMAPETSGPAEQEAPVTAMPSPVESQTQPASNP